MSKFFNQSDSEDEGTENNVQIPVGSQSTSVQQNQNNRDKLVRDFMSSDDESNDRSTVLYEKDKRYKNLREVAAEIKVRIKNQDFVSLLDKYESLNKEFEKGKLFFEKEGKLPRVYIRCLCQIEEVILSINAEQKKKLGVNNSKSYNTLKQRVKKNNQNFKDEITNFINNPVGTDQSEDERKKLRKESKLDNKQKESSSSDDDDDYHLLQSSDPMIRRTYWLKKKKPTSDAPKQPDAPKQTADGPKPPKPDETQIDYDIKFQSQNQAIEVDFTPEAVTKQLEKIVASKGIAKSQVNNIYICEKLVQHFLKDNLRKAAEVLIILLGLQTDQAKTEAPHYFSRQAWLQIVQSLQLLYQLYKEKSIKPETLQTYLKYEGDKTYSECKTVPLTLERFLNSLLLTFNTLENELAKAFQYVDYYAQEYAERISDHYQLIHLSQKLLEVFRSRNDLANASRLCFKQLEGLYYIPPQVIQKLLELQSNKQAATPFQIFGNSDISKKIEELVNMVYKSNEKETTIKACLYWIYNLALNGKYELAYETFLSSVSYEQISQMKSVLQLHYNRALVQLGLAAFRQGLINEAHIHLADLMSRDKVYKDLLAQNYGKISEGEVRYNIPYHMSINIDTIEFVYLLSAMLLEVPNIHQDPFDEGHKVISRKFRQLCQYYDSQSYNSQPESMRELIYAASKELGKGDWSKCWEWIKQVPLWTKFTNHEQIMNLIKQKVQEQALKCYIFSFRNAFTNLSLQHLGTRFELSQQIIRQIIYKMIYYGEIKASLSEPECQYLFFTNDEFAYSQAKRYAAILLEKIGQLTKTNERMLDLKAGSSGAQTENTDQQDQSRKQKNKNAPKYKKVNKRRA